MTEKLNPYESPKNELPTSNSDRIWKGGSDSVLINQGLLSRKVIVNLPVEVTIEYFARGLRDRVIVDGKTAVSKIPVIWFTTGFEFLIPYRDGNLPAKINLKVGRFLKLQEFEILINGVAAYREENGQQLKLS